MARGKWWEYLIPGHNVGLMVGDVYDSITGNSEKNAGTGVFGRTDTAGRQRHRRSTPKR